MPWETIARNQTEMCHNQMFSKKKSPRLLCRLQRSKLDSEDAKVKASRPGRSYFSIQHMRLTQNKVAIEIL